MLESQLRDFVEKLQSLLLLDHPLSWARLEKIGGSKNRLLENILSIKIRAFNPDSLLKSLEERLRFCFTAAFVGLVLFTTFVAVVISVLNWESLFMSLGTLVHLYSIPLIFIVAFAVVTIHEFGHGLTLKHFGGSVEEMGILLLYFIPAFYCNVSDAWLLRKRERVWVINPGHPISRGIDRFIELENSECYGEPFGIPAPDEQVFISWFEGGEVFRSGNCWVRGSGRIFYFSPGHETYPIYHNPLIQRVIANAIHWARPQGSKAEVPRHVPVEQAREKILSRGPQLHDAGGQLG